MMTPMQKLTGTQSINLNNESAQTRQLVRKAHVALSVVLGLAVVSLGIQNKWLEEKLGVERRSNSEMLIELEHYLNMDTRSRQKQAAQVADFQAWAQGKVVYQERVIGVDCRVDRLGQEKWHVTKRRVGGDVTVTADFAIGGPAACDRVQL